MTRRVALLAVHAPSEEAVPEIVVPSFGVLRVQAQLHALADVESRVWDFHDEGPEGVVERVAPWEPDVIGLSLQPWSLGPLLGALPALAGRVGLVVAGGPAALPEVLRAEPWRAL